MEPLFFKAENPPGASPGMGRRRWASMEPLFFKAENEAVCTFRRLDELASMEPLFFKAENESNNEKD